MYGGKGNSVKILVSIISSLTKVVPWKRGDRSPALTNSPSSASNPSTTTTGTNASADYTVGPSRSHPGQWCVTVKETRALRSNLRLNQRVRQNNLTSLIIKWYLLFCVQLLEYSCIITCFQEISSHFHHFMLAVSIKIMW